MAHIGTTIQPIDDIGDVVSRSDDPNNSFEITDATLIGIMQLDSYQACMNCEARVEKINPPIGNCSKCSMLQRINKCAKQLSAKLHFDSAGSNISLHAFTSVLLMIAGHNNTVNDSLCLTVTQEQLLSCPPFSKVTYNIISLCR